MDRVGRDSNPALRTYGSREVARRRQARGFSRGRLRLSRARVSGMKPLSRDASSSTKPLSDRALGRPPTYTRSNSYEPSNPEHPYDSVLLGISGKPQDRTERSRDESPRRCASVNARDACEVGRPPITRQVPTGGLRSFHGCASSSCEASWNQKILASEWRH